MSGSKIFRVGKAGCDAAARVLSRAFTDDPGMAHFLPDDERRRDGLVPLFRFLVKLGMLCGEVYAPSPDIEGVTVWFRSPDLGHGFLKAMRAGYPRVVREWDKPARRRLRSFDAQVMEKHRAHMTADHYYLSLLAVDPPHQRMGFGAFLLEALLTRADAERVPCYLETFSEVDVSIYEKFGFQVAEKCRVDGVSVWLMVRDSG
jgi:GNAT superfamily N-acetyltransferase